MRLFRPASFVLSSLLVSVCLAAQQAPPRDTQAILVLTQCLNAAGGAQALAAIRDFTASGNIIYYWAGQEVQGSVLVRGKGLAGFRVDANLPGGTQTWTVRGKKGSLTTFDGHTSTLPFYNIVTAGSLTIPATRIANALNDQSIGLSYGGLVSLDGRQAYQVRVIPPVEPQIAASGALPGLGAFDLYIDATSLQLLKLTELVRSQGKLRDTYVHEISFSDYRAAGNVVAPFGISEKIGGQRTWSIALTSIGFNTGLTDADFNP